MQQVRHVRGGRAEKSYLHFRVLPLHVSHPLHLVSIIHQRTQDQRDVSRNYCASSSADIVSCIFEYCGQIAGMNTRNILKEFADTLDPASSERKTAKSRAVSSDH